MARLGARMVWATDQALAALRAAAFVVSTGEVAKAIGLPLNDPLTWRALTWLARDGQVERVNMPDAKSVYWQPATPAVELPTPIDLEANDGQ